MKAAFATQDCTRIDAHFGWARHLVIYDVQPEGYHYETTVSFGSLVADGDESKLEAKLAAVEGCALVFSTDIGDVAAARLAVRDIQAMLGYAGQPIVIALEQLQETLRHQPSAWIRRHLQRERQG
jgi:nitrogen fixation protein NifX